VVDPLGGINSLWPLFGIANQLLAAIALCVATTILLRHERARYAWTTLLPLVWLLAITMTAGWQKIFSPNVRIGFLASAADRVTKLATPGLPAEEVAKLERLVFNDYLDAAITAVFLVLVVVVLADSLRAWYGVLGRGSPEDRSRVLSPA
jgi:carbon starvation protein